MGLIFHPNGTGHLLTSPTIGTTDGTRKAKKDTLKFFHMVNDWHKDLITFIGQGHLVT